MKCSFTTYSSRPFNLDFLSNKQLLRQTHTEVHRARNILPLAFFIATFLSGGVSNDLIPSDLHLTTEVVYPPQKMHIHNLTTRWQWFAFFQKLHAIIVTHENGQSVIIFKQSTLQGCRMKQLHVVHRRFIPLSSQSHHMLP